MAGVNDLFAWMDSRRDALKRGLVNQYKDQGAAGVAKEWIKGSIANAAGTADTLFENTTGGQTRKMFAEHLGLPQVPLKDATNALLDRGDTTAGDMGESVGFPLGNLAKAAGLAKVAAAGVLVPAASDKVVKALALIKKGFTPDEVWRLANVEHLPQAGWVREIPDFAAQWNPNHPKASGKLKDFLNHQALYKDAEEGAIANTPVRIQPAGMGPAYNRGTGLTKMPGDEARRAELGPGTTEAALRQDLKGSILHETQHRIQHQSSWQGGSNTEYEKDRILSDLTGSNDPAELARYWNSLGSGARMEVMSRGYLNYGERPGERMARAVDERSSWDPMKLGQIRPGLTPDPWLDALHKAALQNGVKLPPSAPYGVSNYDFMVP